MTRTTEWLLRIGAAVACLYFGWQLYLGSIGMLLTLRDRAIIAERQAQACEQAKAKAGGG